MFWKVQLCSRALVTGGGLTPAPWQDRCFAGAHLYLSFTSGVCPELLSTLSICSLLASHSKSSASPHQVIFKSHSKAQLRILIFLSKQKTIILQRDAGSIGPQNGIISDIFCIYLTASVLPYCVFVCGFLDCSHSVWGATDLNTIPSH